MQPFWISKPGTRRALYFLAAGITAAYFLGLYIIPPIHQYNSFRLFNFDYGILFQSTDLISQSRELFLTTRGVYAWADNQDYFQVVLSLLQHLPESHYWLLISHSISLFACGLFCLLVLSKYGRYSALAVAMSVWLSPFFINMNLDLFHTEAFASIFLLLLYLAGKTGNRLLFYLFLLAAISCKEDIALTAGFFMILAMLSPARFKLTRTHYFIGLLTCIALLTINLAVVLPYFKVQTCLRLDPNAVVEKLDASPASKNFQNIFSNWYRFSFVKSALLRGHAGSYLLMLMWPAILFFKNRPLLFLLPLPGILINLLSYSGHFTEAYYHYDHCTMAAVVIAVMDSWTVCKRKKTASFLFLLLSIFVSGYLADVRIPVYAGLEKNFYRFKKSAEVGFLERLNRSLPESTRISADYQTINYLIKDHPDIYMFENPFETSHGGFGLDDACDTFKDRPPIDIVVIRNGYDIDPNLRDILSTEYYGLSEQSALFRFWVHPSFLNSSRSDHFKLLVEEIRNSHAQPCLPQNTLKNGSFEQSTGEQPNAWQLETWKKPAECPACRFQTETAFSKEGATALFSKHADFNVSRWVQDVPVAPNTPYRLSGWIKTEGVSHSQTGAYLQVDAIAQRPWPAFGTTKRVEFLGRTPELFNSSDWRYVEIVFRTRRDHKRVKVICGLGDFGAHVKGSVYFDGIQLRDLADQYECDLFSRLTELN